MFFLAVLGPGFITANVDNDSGGILTYSQAGAQYGYTLLWTMIPITLALIVVQEMCARMGVVTFDQIGVIAIVVECRAGKDDETKDKQC